MSQTTSQEKPLTDQEKYQILSQLFQLQGIIEKTFPQYAAEIEKLQLSVAAEKAARDSALEIERKLTAAAERERDVYKEKAELCETTNKVVKKGRSFGCWIKKFFTAWMSGCH